MRDGLQNNEVTRVYAQTDDMGPGKTIYNEINPVVDTNGVVDPNNVVIGKTWTP